MRALNLGDEPKLLVHELHVFNQHRSVVWYTWRVKAPSSERRFKIPPGGEGVARENFRHPERN